MRNTQETPSNRTFAPPVRSRLAFTLIELLAVIGIISILAAMITGVARFAWQKARKGRTRAHIEKIHNVLLEYKMENGAYPVSLAEVESRFPSGVTTNDAWGRGFVYELVNIESCTLYSHGPRTDIEEDNLSSGR
jgi:prepilin-type N-terminal cleavage/methylation domain-containing protein